jgi:hypothetical protein
MGRMHLMIEEADAGPIAGVELFHILPGIIVSGLEELACAQLAQLFRRLAPVLAARTRPLLQLTIRWSGKNALAADTRPYRRNPVQ